MDIDTIAATATPPPLTPAEVEEEERRLIWLHEDEVCATCGGSGSIPIGAAGNMELETNCPECTPDFR